VQHDAGQCRPGGASTGRAGPRRGVAGERAASSMSLHAGAPGATGGERDAIRRRGGGWPRLLRRRGRCWWCEGCSGLAPHVVPLQGAPRAQCAPKRESWLDPWRGGPESRARCLRAAHVAQPPATSHLPSPPSSPSPSPPSHSTHSHASLLALLGRRPFRARRRTRRPLHGRAAAPAERARAAPAGPPAAGHGAAAAGPRAGHVQPGASPCSHAPHTSLHR
jgi:hypothetical protein